MAGLAVSSLHGAAGHGKASRGQGRVASSAAGPMRALVTAGGRPGRAVYATGGTAAAAELWRGLARDREREHAEGTYAFVATVRSSRWAYLGEIGSGARRWRRG